MWFGGRDWSCDGGMKGDGAHFDGAGFKKCRILLGRLETLYTLSGSGGFYMEC